MSSPTITKNSAPRAPATRARKTNAWPASPWPRSAGLARLLVTPPPPVAAADPRLNWLVIRDDAALCHLRAEWSRLADRCEAALFLTPEWTECWRTAIAPDVRPRIVTGWDESGRLRVAWPLGIRRCGGRTLQWRTLEPMGAAVASGDRLGPLADAVNFEADLLAEVRRLAAREADVIRLHELPDTSVILPAAQADPINTATRLSDQRVLPIIRLPHDWESFARTVSAKLLGHVRRQERAAVDRHGMVWRLNDEAGSLDAAIQGFMQVHQHCWQHRGETGNFARQALTAFVRAFAHVAHRRGWLRLHRLCLGDRTVAALLGFHHGSRAYYYQSGWDPDFTSLSPGSLCIARAIRMAIEERLTVFDFLRGDEPYKRRWAADQERTVTLTAPVTHRGRVVVTANDAKERIKRAVVLLAGERGWEWTKRWTQRGASK